MCPKWFQSPLFSFYSQAFKDTETMFLRAEVTLLVSFERLTWRDGSSPVHMFNVPYIHCSREFLCSQLSWYLNNEKNPSYQLLPFMWSVSTYCTVIYDLSRHLMSSEVLWSECLRWHGQVSHRTDGCHTWPRRASREQGGCLRTAQMSLDIYRGANYFGLEVNHILLRYRDLFTSLKLVTFAELNSCPYAVPVFPLSAEIKILFTRWTS